ncbi:hypothetical protein F4677DRAFT_319565 [Hypoxylon crocopeplum]|nr:hypothetical protein F4677DRAFT_319565 [Hypoxylon crocopeplum]
MASRYAAVHQLPRGPGDLRPTAINIIRHEDLEQRLSDKVVFVTECSSGIGAETALAFFLTGATLYLTAQSLPMARMVLRMAARRMPDLGTPDPGDIISNDHVHFLELDISSLESVRSCAASFLSQSKTLDFLVCNTGLVMTPPEGRAESEFEKQFGTKHLAHFLLFNLLQPALLAGATPRRASRVVISSSGGYRSSAPNSGNTNFEGNYDVMATHASRKTAILWMANEIERRFGANGIHAWSVHPGAVSADLHRHISIEQMTLLRNNLYLAPLFKSTSQGAATGVWAAMASALEGQGGGYLENCQIAMPWDPSSATSTSGYGSHAYDQEKAAEFWAKSLECVGL